MLTDNRSAERQRQLVGGAPSAGGMYAHKVRTTVSLDAAHTLRLRTVRSADRHFVHTKAHSERERMYVRERK